MQKSRKGLFLFLIILVAAVGILAYTGKLPGRNQSAGAQSAKILLEADSRAKFKVFGKSFIQVTKDGAKYFNQIDDQKWNDTYTMTSPVVVSEGGYTAVAEMMGRSVRVYNDAGLLYTVSTSGSVVRAALNENGYLSLILFQSATASYKIEVYSTSGTLRLERAEQDANVYPLAADVSDDNRVLAVSYLDGDDVEVISKISFFYVNETDGVNYDNAMFAAADRPGELIPEIRFMKDNLLVAVSDVTVFGVTKDGNEVFSIPLTNEIAAVGLDNKDTVTLAYGQIMSGSEGKQVGDVEWYNLKGNLNGSFSAGAAVTYLRSANGVTVVGANRDYYGLTKSGKLLWSYKATQDIEDILALDDGGTVLLVTKTQAEVVNMNQQTPEAPETEAEPDLETSAPEED